MSSRSESTATTTSATTATLTGARRAGVLVAMCLSVLVIGLDTTVLSVALPTLAADLDASTSQLQWMANAYNLVLAALLLPAGLLGDRYGRRRMLVIALLLFGAASLACALSWSAGALIAARGLLGIGAALIVPVAMSLVTVLFPTPDDRRRAMSFFMVANSVSMPLGPIVGGLLLDHAGWHSIFWINVPVAVLAAVAVRTLIPESRSGRRPGIDWIGIVLSSTGLAAVVYGVTRLGDRGWSDPVALVLVGAGVVVLGIFVRTQRRSGAMLVQLSLFRRRVYTGGAVLATFAILAMFGLLFVMPQYFQGIAGSDALHTGLKLLPLIAGMLAGAKLAERLDAALGPRVVIVAGFAALVIGFGLGTATDLGTGYGYTAGWFAVVGVGLGWVMPPAMTAALGALDPERAGSGSALLQALRQVGGTVGITVLGTVLNGAYRLHVDVTGLSAPAADAARKSLGGGLAVARDTGSAALLESVRHAFLYSFRTTLWLSAAIAAAGAVLAAVLMPRRQARSRPG